MEFQLPVMKTIRALSEETGLSYVFLRELIRENKITYVQAGRKYLINSASLAAYLNGEGVKE